MLHFAGADTECERRECAVRRRVRIAAHHRHSGQRCALLWADHMHDTAPHITHFEIGQAVFFSVGVERLNLHTRYGIKNRREARCGWRVVIRHRDHAGLAPRLATGQLQPLKRLRAGHFMHQMAVDVEQRRAVVLGANDVCVEELVVERAASHDVLTYGKGTNILILCACRDCRSRRRLTLRRTCAVARRTQHGSARIRRQQKRGVFGAS